MPSSEDARPRTPWRAITGEKTLLNRAWRRRGSSSQRSDARGRSIGRCGDRSGVHRRPASRGGRNGEAEAASQALLDWAAARSKSQRSPSAREAARCSIWRDRPESLGGPAGSQCAGMHRRKFSVPVHAVLEAPAPRAYRSKALIPLDRGAGPEPEGWVLRAGESPHRGHRITSPSSTTALSNCLRISGSIWSNRGGPRTWVLGATEDCVTSCCESGHRSGRCCWLQQRSAPRIGAAGKPLDALVAAGDRCRAQYPVPAEQRDSRVREPIHRRSKLARRNKC